MEEILNYLNKLKNKIEEDRKLLERKLNKTDFQKITDNQYGRYDAEILNLKQELSKFFPEKNFERLFKELYSDIETIKKVEKNVLISIFRELYSLLNSYSQNWKAGNINKFTDSDFNTFIVNLNSQSKYLVEFLIQSIIVINNLNNPN